jgi:hypothetical protein
MMLVLNALSNSIQNYPIQWAGFARATVLCAAAFGLKLSAEQIAALMLVVESGLTVYTHQTISNQGEAATK